MNYSGLVIAVITFVVIVLFVVAVFWGSDYMLSPFLGVVGRAGLSSIFVIFEQKERVEKGWFPKNPKRKDEYK